jgi:hypothetical protein
LNGINPIQREERHGSPLELFWIWFAANIGILGVVCGAQYLAGNGLNLWQSEWACSSPRRPSSPARWLRVSSSCWFMFLPFRSGCWMLSLVGHLARRALYSGP